MLQTFKTYQLAVQFHQGCEKVQVPSYLRDQRKYWTIALGSLRESQAALQLCRMADQSLDGVADQLGACLYRLCHPK